MGKSVSFKKILRACGLFVGITLCIAMIGIASAIYNDTLIRWWIPVAMSVGVAVMIGVPFSKYWRRVTLSENRIVNFIVHIFVVGSVWSCGMMAGNYFLADNSSEHIEHGVVERKYSEKHYHTKRVSRRIYYGNGRPYYVYNVTVKFDNGRLKTFRMPLSKYNSMRTGDTLALNVKQGFFGMPVIDIPEQKHFK